MESIGNCPDQPDLPNGFLSSEVYPLGKTLFGRGIFQFNHSYTKVTKVCGGAGIRRKRLRLSLDPILPNVNSCSGRGEHQEVRGSQRPSLRNVPKLALRRRKLQSPHNEEYDLVATFHPRSTTDMPHQEGFWTLLPNQIPPSFSLI